MSKYTAEEIKAAASTVQSMRWHADEGEEMMRVADMLRDYAAHLAAQAEWPSDEDVRKACAAYGERAWNHAEPPAMRAALQSVRPPAGVVSVIYPSEYSDDRLRRIIDPECGYDYEARSLASAWLASRHAPTKD